MLRAGRYSDFQAGMGFEPTSALTSFKKRRCADDPAQTRYPARNHRRRLTVSVSAFHAAAAQ